jgi:hypothetical protein
MKPFIILVAVLYSPCSFSQDGFDSLRSIAYNYYVNEHKPDSAVYWYLQLAEKYPDRNKAIVQNAIGNCYLKMGLDSIAENHYLFCLSAKRSKEPASNAQTNASLSLSEMYYRKGLYRKSLTFLEYTKTIYMPMKRLCRSGGGGHLQDMAFAHKKSVCYYGMNMKDSAVAVLTPYMFWPTRDVLMDSVAYDMISRYFVFALFDLLGKDEARVKLQEAVRNRVYTLKYKVYGTDTTIFASAECYVIYAGAKIFLDPGYGIQVLQRDEIPENLAETKLLNEFMESPAYQYITKPGFIEYPGYISLHVPSERFMKRRSLN